MPIKFKKSSEYKQIAEKKSSPLFHFHTLLILAKKKTLSFENVFVCPATSYFHRGKSPIIIGAGELNFRVRHGNGCDLSAIVTRLFLKGIILSKLDNIY